MRRPSIISSTALSFATLSLQINLRFVTMSLGEALTRAMALHVRLRLPKSRFVEQL